MSFIEKANSISFGTVETGIFNDSGKYGLELENGARLFAEAQVSGRGPADGTTNLSQLSPNLDLVETGNAIDVKQADLVRFERDRFELGFIRSKHKNITPGEGMAAIIELGIERYKPDAFIIEGFPTEKDFTDWPFREHYEENPNIEILYAGALAQEAGISVLGAEPSQKDIVTSLLDEGYTAQDYLAFRLIRNFSDAINNQEKIGNDSELKKNFKEVAPIYIENIDLPQDYDFSYNDLASWFEEKGGKTLTVENIHKNEAAPRPEGTAIQQMAYEVSHMRNLHMAQAIANALNEHGKVMIIAGTGHYDALQKTLEDMLGEGRVVAIESD